MGLFDLAAPVLAAIDHAIANLIPGGIRLALWGVLSGWLTMLLYRRFSRQEAIAELKTAQKKQQEDITRFEGEFNELMPMVKQAFSLGFRQLGLSFGPAVLATIPILFIVAWVATNFVYSAPVSGENIFVSAQPESGQLRWSGNANAKIDDSGWSIQWPEPGQSITLENNGAGLLSLSDEQLHAVIHKRRWWNLLFGNPAGYLPEDQPVDIVRVDLPQRQYLSFGPEWMRGWMFLFFGSFLLASVAFKFVLRIE
jgi:hypothetical protein